MDELLRDYLPILVFLAISIGLGVVLILAAAVIAVRNPDPEKVSAYECGLNNVVAHWIFWQEQWFKQIDIIISIDAKWKSTIHTVPNPLKKFDIA